MSNPTPTEMALLLDACRAIVQFARYCLDPAAADPAAMAAARLDATNAASALPMYAEYTPELVCTLEALAGLTNSPDDQLLHAALRADTTHAA